MFSFLLEKHNLLLFICLSICMHSNAEEYLKSGGSNGLELIAVGEGVKKGWSELLGGGGVSQLVLAPDLEIHLYMATFCGTN